MTQADLDAFDAIPAACRKLRQSLGTVIVGQEHAIELLLAALLCQGHVLMVGVPGLAKTLLARSLAGSLDLAFRRIQFTPDLMPGDILGAELIQSDPETGARSLQFAPGPVFANLVLADEINRASPKTQSALLEAMAERQVTVAGHSRPLDPPFMVVATQNPIEQEGTYPLPEAQLDRFLFGLRLDYPGRDEEVAIVERSSTMGHTASPGAGVDQVTGSADHAAVVDRRTLTRWPTLLAKMPVSRLVTRYAVDVARSTRPSDRSAGEMVRAYVQWGAGPRAAQSLVFGARALAAMDGLPTPGIEHVRRVADAVLCHRLVLNYTATGEGVSPESVVAHIIASVAEPEEL